jgi:hypothetical protein
MQSQNTALSWTIFVVVVTLSSAGIFYGSSEPPQHPMDQSFIQNANVQLYKENGHWVFQYPHLQWAGGISATLLVGLYKLILDPTANLNWHIKIFVMLLWSVSLLMLTRTFIRSEILRASALLCTAALGLQFLEPTTELIAAVFLNFSVLLMLRQRFLLSGAFLALFSLVKIELLPISIVIAAYVMFRYDSLHRQKFIFGYLACLFVLVGPALYINGLGGILGGEKHALAAFADHYNWLSERDIVPGEIGPFRQSFGNPNSFSQAVVSNPLGYLNFVARSSVLSAWNMFLAGNVFFVGFLLFMCWIRFSWRYDYCGIRKEYKPLLDLVLITMLSTMLLGTAFAFVHIRYTTRFAALAVVLFVMMLEACLTKRSTITSITAGQSSPRLISGLLATVAIFSLWHLPAFLSDPHTW